MKGDYWLFLSNCFSLILGVWLCLTAIHILEQNCDDEKDLRDERLRVRVEVILLFTITFWIVISFIVALPLRDEKYFSFNIAFVGSFAVVSSLVFYASPLMHIIEVMKSKDSSSLYYPAIFVNMLSCLLWFFYGLEGVHAPVVWIPNGLGALLCVIELFTCWYYPQLERNSFDGCGGKIVSESSLRSDFAVFESSRSMALEELFAPRPAALERQKFKKSFSNISVSNIPCYEDPGDALDDVIPIPSPACVLRDILAASVDTSAKCPPRIVNFTPTDELSKV